MTWRIFRKDFKLMWRMALGVGLIHLTQTVIAIQLAHFGNYPRLRQLADLIVMMGIFGTAFLIAGVVQQDAIPGIRQDWLVRPVKRTSLLLSKLLFVVLVAQGPILAGDLAEGLAFGFSLQESLGAAISRSLWLLFALDLPLLAFATLTRTLTEAVAAGVAVFMGVGGLEIALNELNHDGRLDATLRTGVAWITESTMVFVALLGTAVVLGLQYYRRKTIAARWTTGGICVLCLVVEFFPWQSAFAIQQRLSLNPPVAQPIALAFAPGMGKFHDLSGLRRADRAESDVMTVALPLQASGLPADVVLKVDRAEVRWIDAGGKSETLGSNSNLEIRKNAPGDGPVGGYQSVWLSSAIYDRVKDRPVRLEIDYSLTLLKLTASHAIPAVRGDQRTPAAGWCKTRINAAGTAVQLLCLSPGKTPACTTVFLEHPRDGQRNPERSNCSPDYSPYAARFQPDAFLRFAVNLPFRDPSGVVPYSVSGSDIAESQVVLRLYSPEDHFTRQLVIPAIQLNDWLTGI